MAFVLEDRVIETANGPGQGDFELLGATGDNRTFVFGIGDGNTTRYLAVGAEGWEIGIGTVQAGSPDRLLRPGSVSKNSNGNTTPIDFGGIVTLACIVSVEDVAWIDDGGILQAPGGAFRSPSTPVLLVERLGQQINAVVEHKTEAGSVYSGHASPGMWAVGRTVNLANAANRWLELEEDGARVRGGFRVDGPLSIGSNPIVERGNNSNGHFVRLADGTAIAWHEIPDLGPVSTSAGSIYASSLYTWVYPTGFVANPTVQVSGIRSAAAVSPVWGAISQVSPSSVNYWLLCGQDLGSSILRASLTAFGRWS